MCLKITVLSKRLYHTNYIHRALLQNVIFYAFEDYDVEQSPHHTDYMHRVSLQYVFFYAFEE